MLFRRKCWNITANAIFLSLQFHCCHCTFGFGIVSDDKMEIDMPSNGLWQSEQFTHVLFASDIHAVCVNPPKHLQKRISIFFLPLRSTHDSAKIEWTLRAGRDSGAVLVNFCVDLMGAPSVYLKEKRWITKTNSLAVVCILANDEFFGLIPRVFVNNICRFFGMGLWFVDFYLICSPFIVSYALMHWTWFTNRHTINRFLRCLVFML